MRPDTCLLHTGVQSAPDTLFLDIAPTGMPVKQLVERTLVKVTQQTRVARTRVLSATHPAGAKQESPPQRVTRCPPSASLPCTQSCSASSRVVPPLAERPVCCEVPVDALAAARERARCLIRERQSDFADAEQGPVVEELLVSRSRLPDTQQVPLYGLTGSGFLSRSAS